MPLTNVYIRALYIYIDIYIDTVHLTPWTDDCDIIFLFSMTE